MLSAAVDCQSQPVEMQQRYDAEVEVEQRQQNASTAPSSHGLFKRGSTASPSDLAMLDGGDHATPGDEKAHDGHHGDIQVIVNEDTTQQNDDTSIVRVSDVAFSEEDICDILLTSGDRTPIEELFNVIDHDDSTCSDGDHPAQGDHQIESTTESPVAKQEEEMLLSSSFTQEDPSHLRLTLDQRRSSSPQPPSPLAYDDSTIAVTRCEMVAKEIVLTERAYVNSLQEIIEGYLFHVFHHGPPIVDVEKIFSNLEEIFDFNKALLDDLEMCSSNPGQVAECFVQKAKGFNLLYSQYCTSYPEAAAFLSEILVDNKEVSAFFADRQRALGHALPIESYLLKPVQRITKYHLLLKDMLKYTKEDDPAAETIKAALDDMTDVADYINEMKRLQEDIVKAHDVLETILGIGSLDVFKTGRLVLENSFRVHGYRGDRHLFLFEKLLLICKKVEDGLFHLKNGLMCSNMMLVESISKEPTAFRIIRFDNRKVVFNIQARSIEIKRNWVQHIKRLLLENHPALVPVTAKQAILGASNKRSKYNTISLDAGDDFSEKIFRQQKSKGTASSGGGKENRHSPSTAANKRDSHHKHDDATADKDKKASLNSKARDFLDKKTKALHLITSPDKSTRAWPRFRKSTKQGKTSVEVEAAISPQVKSTLLSIAKRNRAGVANGNDGANSVMRSKSMESLRRLSMSMNAPSASPGSPPAPDKQDTIAKGNDDDAARKQIHRLSMLHDLMSIDLETEAASTIATESPAIVTSYEPVGDSEGDRGQVSPILVTYDDFDLENIPPLPGASPVIRVKQSRARPASLLTDEGATKKKYLTTPSPEAGERRGEALLLDNDSLPLIDCHSSELKSRLGSSRETMLIDDNVIGLLDDANSSSLGKVATAANATKGSGLQEDDYLATTEDLPLQRTTAAGPISSDDEYSMASIESTVRRVNEAFSSLQRQGDDEGIPPGEAVVRNASAVDETLDHVMEQQPPMFVRPRARSAFALLDSTDVNYAKTTDSEGDDEPLSPPDTPYNPTRSNSEGNALLMQRIDSVQSELDEACQDFSMVVAEMESPLTSPRQQPPSNRTPVKQATLATYDGEESRDHQQQRGTKAEAKVVRAQRRSSAAELRSSSAADFKRVSDRIRAYSCLVEASSSFDVASRSPGEQRRPKSQAHLNELFESLDKSTEEASPVYRSQRRRFQRNSFVGSGKTPLSRSESQPTGGGGGGEGGTADDALLPGARLRAVSDLGHRTSDIRLPSNGRRGVHQTRSLPRKSVLDALKAMEAERTDDRDQGRQSDDNASTSTDRDVDGGGSRTPDSVGGSSAASDDSSCGDAGRERSWSQECGTLVSRVRYPFHPAVVSAAAQPSRTNPLSTRSPSLRYIQRSIVHRRVKEYIENVIKPGERELPSARQRSLHPRPRATSSIEECDENDGSATADASLNDDAVEKGTVERLRGKFNR